MSLHQLKCGKCGKIICNPVRRLREMGLVKGKRVCKIRVAPFGSSAEYAILNYRLILRDTDINSVTIDKLN